MKQVFRLSPDEVQQILCQHVVDNMSGVRDGTELTAVLQVFFDSKKQVRYFEVTLESKNEN